MRSLFFTSIVAIILNWAGAPKPIEDRKLLCADGTVQPSPTFDMLLSSDVMPRYVLTDWL